MKDLDFVKWLAEHNYVVRKNVSFEVYAQYLDDEIFMGTLDEVYQDYLNGLY